MPSELQCFSTAPGTPDNYNEGDRLFIFGFSRGAYTARSLSGFISKCGLLKPGSPLSINQLYGRYRRRTDKTIRELIQNIESGATSQAGLALEESWLLRYSSPITIDFLGIWDTVGSLGVPVGMKRNVAKYRFLDTHLRLSNTNAYHALAVDEHRASFTPTLWTRTTAAGANPAPSRPIENVEQRWFVGAHANVGGGYPSDLLAQVPLGWLMAKAATHGLKFRGNIETDQANVDSPIADSYAAFLGGLYRFFSRRYFRPIGAEPSVGSAATTSTINETIDRSVFDRWRTNPSYRPRNLETWARRNGVDPSEITHSVLAADANVKVPD
ncbi:DUF2235 domain-containing protein [Mesorhizobium sp. M1A.F.Ca.IN.020.06.1.1]|nr:DUF2235 domain-containing protein [Mesorhizobium sp. M1A.F.Ca.IN.020.32.1.1]RUW02851.1 DUF2235 domain-containing protein [Mesorhizobium sp. M1A.F.Ca.IN.022.05.2.1]RUW29497.1 DUF2235 domain-containing protein [Mesorhizobium sp. M1A.F.Ca.IN.020.06.1.1]RWF81233.1 MAG: DUF2235 domain-containing protein [Mesorhizobium sp.]RWG02162.1 MAG: DUF2235 domain-containing protein [Mesorhizobium sp.]